ncbi:MAG: FkbM family methyltransferase [Steroidobacteraceae bacterium]
MINPILRLASRVYVRHAPWRFGKLKAIEAYLNGPYKVPSRSVVRTSFGSTMDLETPDLVSGIIYVTGAWEPAITRFVSERLRPGDIFVDVGANIGYYTLMAAKIVGNHGRVHAIEASPTIFDRLRQNVAMNSLRNVQLIQAAAAGSPGQLAIYRAPQSNLGHSSTVPEVAAAGQHEFEAYVRADTLSTLVGPDLWNARFVKIDVEGAENQILAALLDDLHRFQGTEWLVELTPRDSTAAGVFDAFRRAGYNCYRIPNVYDCEFHLRTSFPLAALDDVLDEPCDVVMSRARLV